MCNIFYPLFSTLALLVSCQSQPKEKTSESREVTQPIMTVSLSLSSVTEGFHVKDKLLFSHTFDTSHSEKFEDYGTFSINHQIVPDRAEVYDEVCQIIIKWKADDYTCAMHMPIREREYDEHVNPSVGYRVNFTSKIPKPDTTKQIKTANKIE